MRFEAEPGFQHRSSEPRYFVRRLAPDDSGFARGYRWEVQLLNEDGQGAATVQFGPTDGTEVFDLLKIDLPAAVVAAAKAGAREYVDTHGQPHRPF